MAFDCPSCSAVFSRSWSLRRHIQRVHNNKKVSSAQFCKLCKTTYESVIDYQNHIDRLHRVGSSFTVHETALQGTYRTYRHTATENEETFEQTFTFGRMQEMKNLIQREVLHSRSIKYYITYTGEFEMLDHNGDVTEIDNYPFREETRQCNELTLKGVFNQLKLIKRDIQNRIDDFIDRGSGWVLRRSRFVDISIASMASLKGGCRQKITDLDFSEHLEDKQLIEATPDNGEEDFCFIYCIAAYFLRQKKVTCNKTNLEKFISQHINYKDFEFPFDIKQVDKFEKQNKHLDLCISVVYGVNDQIYPAYSSKTNGSVEISLYLYSRLENGNVETDNRTYSHHFLLINKLDLFLQKIYYNGARTIRQKSFYCTNCFSRYSSKLGLTAHRIKCLKAKGKSVKLAPGYSYFENHNKRFKIPILGFFDFESANKRTLCKICKCYKCDCETTAKTKALLEQVPISYSVVWVDTSHNSLEIIESRSYSGEDAVEDFLNYLGEVNERLIDYMIAKPMEMSDADFTNYEAATLCHICKNGLNGDKVRDHDHATGFFLGAAHNKCNLKRRKQRSIPLYAHNFAGYDSHPIMAQLGRDNPFLKISILARNSEKYTSVNLDNFQLMDTMSFMQTSLDNMAQDLVNDIHEFSLLHQFEKLNTPEKFVIATRKNVFPYDFIKSARQVRNTTEFPSRDDFYNKLTEEHISEEDYKFAKQVWYTMDFQNFEEYMEFYCMIDVLLLAESFLKFRTSIHRNFKLDCAQYVTLPSLAYDAMLLKTGAKISLDATEDMYHFIRQSIRGGHSFIGQRYCKAEIGKDDIAYIDMNNLYGFAQRQLMPVGEYRWSDYLNETNISTFNPDLEYGFICEVDLEYPEHLHTDHASFPLAPDHVTITRDMLSPYSKECLDTLESKSKIFKDKKLTSTFLPRKNYVCHLKTLQLYINLGMKVTKVHKSLCFKQSDFLSKYVDFCTEQRAMATSTFEKNVYKLMNNSVFGKFLEDKTKHVHVHICTSQERAKNLASLPHFANFKILGEELIIVQMKKMETIIDKPFMIGFCILELSKYFMYAAYYGPIMKAFKKPTVLMSDTDSFILHFPSENKDVTFAHFAKFMDFSNYPSSSSLYNTKRKNKLGYFKDEMKGSSSISEFVGLRSKTYALKVVDNNLHTTKDKKICKGVKRSAVRNNITFEHYKECIDTMSVKTCDMHAIRSKSHKLYIIKQNKVAFSSFDSKRYILSCGIHTVPFGDFRLKRRKSVKYCFICKKKY